MYSLIYSSSTAYILKSSDTNSEINCLQLPHGTIGSNCFLSFFLAAIIIYSKSFSPFDIAFTNADFSAHILIIPAFYTFTPGYSFPDFVLSIAATFKLLYGL